MARKRSTTLLAAAAALAVAGLAGCGEEDAAPAAEPSVAASTATTPSASPSPKATPEPLDCKEVWGGQQLPRRYQGCLRGGELVKAAKLFCSSGQVIVTFDNRYYAVPGGPVNDVGSLKSSKQFQQASRSCSA